MQGFPCLSNSKAKPLYYWPLSLLKIPACNVDRTKKAKIHCDGSAERAHTRVTISSSLSSKKKAAGAIIFGFID